MTNCWYEHLLNAQGVPIHKKDRVEFEHSLNFSGLFTYSKHFINSEFESFLLIAKSQAHIHQVPYPNLI